VVLLVRRDGGWCGFAGLIRRRSSTLCYVSKKSAICHVTVAWVLPAGRRDGLPDLYTRWTHGIASLATLLANLRAYRPLYQSEPFMVTLVASRRNRMKQNSTRSRTLQFRVSVKDVKPEIWRKLLVSSDITLERLHAILQVLMGWRDNHLYAFVIDKKRYFPPSEHDTNIETQSSIRTKLSNVFAKNVAVITYEYDFGDRWEIELCNEPKNDGFQQKQSTECIEGSRHGPVEDSGGPREYMEKVKIYDNPRHKRYQEIREFIGPKFDPETFDLRKTNEMLKEFG